MSKPGLQKFFIETWGCQMNELDTQRMSGQLRRQGMEPARVAEEADLVLLNSCSVREKAEQKVYSRLGRFRQYKADRPHMMIGLCGCVAQEAGERALQRVPDLDFVLGPARVGELVDIVAQRRLGERVVATGFPEAREYDLDSISREGSYKGMVTIIEGCDKKCTFCIVPLTRGPERSRKIEDILAEVEHLVAGGFVEIELLGQTVNHWRDPTQDLDFADLLDAVARTEGVERLRFVTSYPRDFTQRMVDQFAIHSNICPYLHLPVQSGSNSVLKKMARGYTVEAYFELIAGLRVARPEIALSTDLIVGFPGETDEDFEATLRLVRQVRYASIYAFKYSPRPGTAAPNLPDQVPTEVADRRLQRIFKAQEEIQRELNEGLVGSVQDVLVTGFGKRPGMATGRTACHRVVHLPLEQTPSPTLPTSPIGQLVAARIEQAHPHSLIASVV